MRRARKHGRCFFGGVKKRNSIRVFKRRSNLHASATPAPRRTHQGPPAAAGRARQAGARGAAASRAARARPPPAPTRPAGTTPASPRRRRRRYHPRRRRRHRRRRRRRRHCRRRPRPSARPLYAVPPPPPPPSPSAPPRSPTGRLRLAPKGLRSPVKARGLCPPAAARGAAAATAARAAGPTATRPGAARHAARLIIMVCVGRLMIWTVLAWRLLLPTLRGTARLRGAVACTLRCSSPGEGVGAGARAQLTRLPIDAAAVE